MDALNLDLRATDIVALFETNKTQRQTFVTMVIDSLTNGDVDPLKIHLQVKCMEDIIADLKEDATYRELVLNAAQTNGKSFEYQNAKIEVREVGTKYDFSGCDDPVYNELAYQAKVSAAALKARETVLKAIPITGMVITDESTGETNKVYPPAKSSTTSVVVTLK